MPRKGDKKTKPDTASKKNTTDRLKAKGVPEALAKHLSGEDEDLTLEEIAERRISWQQNLPRG